MSHSTACKRTCATEPEHPRFIAHRLFHQPKNKIGITPGCRHALQERVAALILPHSFVVLQGEKDWELETFCTSHALHPAAEGRWNDKVTANAHCTRGVYHMSLRDHRVCQVVAVGPPASSHMCRHPRQGLTCFSLPPLETLSLALLPPRKTLSSSVDVERILRRGVLGLEVGATPADMLVA